MFCGGGWIFFSERFRGGVDLFFRVISGGGGSFFPSDLRETRVECVQQMSKCMF